MQPTNLLFIMSDEHCREAIGSYGGAHMHTPNLDRLAAQGTRFTSAYTPSPICVPARASLATGRYVHQIGTWSSAEPYDGSVPGWGHRLIADGHRVVSIGKLHYRDTSDPNGFDEEILPMHVVGGIGWAKGLLRKSLPTYESARQLAEQIGPGDSTYVRYDRRVCAAACEWLRNSAATPPEKPWVLFVSFVSPHYPLTPPTDFYQRYPLEGIRPPRLYAPDARPTHPVVQALQGFFNYDDYFDEDSVPVAQASYYGLCSFLDAQIGEILQTLAATGAHESTRIVYTSDHGEMLGNHGFWAKSVMYEESAAIPLIVTGPDVPRGTVVHTPVSLIDCYQTIVESVGETLTAEEANLPGHSLVGIANGERPERTILSEYHDGGSITGFFMIRLAQWKYVHYVGYPPQLFDMGSDPHEANDLGQSPAHAEIRAACETRLRALLDPDEVNTRAFTDQARKIEELGGEQACRNAFDFNFTPVGGAA